MGQGTGANRNRKVQTGQRSQNRIDPFSCGQTYGIWQTKKKYEGGYLFLQFIYYGLRLDKVCRKIKSGHKFKYDLNAILSDLIYARILEPDSKRSTFMAVQDFLEPPAYELHDIYRALSVLAEECDFIQAEAYKSKFSR